MILSAFCLPSAGLLVVSFPAGLFAILAGGLGFLSRFPVAEFPEELKRKGSLIPGKICMVLGSFNPSVRVSLENCFLFGIG